MPCIWSSSNSNENINAQDHGKWAHFFSLAGKLRSFTHRWNYFDISFDTSSALSDRGDYDLVDLQFHGWYPRRAIAGAIQLISWGALKLLCGGFVKPDGNAYFFCKQSFSEAFIHLYVLTLIHKLNLTANLAERNCYRKMKCLIYGNVACVENNIFLWAYGEKDVDKL